MTFNKSRKIQQLAKTDDYKIIPFRDQIYENLKRECKFKKCLFEDPIFPAENRSIYYTKPVPKSWSWKRPHEIVKNPVFTDGFDPNDCDQGQLGDCWVISGCAAISLVPELLKKVVPPDQTFDESDYAGIFHFRFWQYGQWIDVVIDDRLPVTEDNELVFCKTKENENEFWAALLEKAYAKLCLCYENLNGGCTIDAIVDMSGAIVENFDIKKMQNEKQKNIMWDVIVKARKYGSMMCCSIAPDPDIKEKILSNGLVQGHGYIVTKIAEIERYGKSLKLLRLRNPWGNEVEWLGDWSDDSLYWYEISDDIKALLNFERKPNGEFWMDYDDFYKIFDDIEICNITPDTFSNEVYKSKSNNFTWKMIAYDGAWITGLSAGGCGKSDRKKYWSNPQFLVTLSNTNPEDGKNMATIIVSLLQKYTIQKRIHHNGEWAELYVQFRIYRIINKEDAFKARKNGTKLYAEQLEPVGMSGGYINSRDVTKRFRLPLGDYLIIPSCYHEDKEGDFFLRIFVEKRINSNIYSVLDRCKKNLTDDDIQFNNGKSDESFNVSYDLHNNIQREDDKLIDQWKSGYAPFVIRSRKLFNLNLPYNYGPQTVYQKYERSKRLTRWF